MVYYTSFITICDPMMCYLNSVFRHSSVSSGSSFGICERWRQWKHPKQDTASMHMHWKPKSKRSACWRYLINLTEHIKYAFKEKCVLIAA